MKIIKSYFFIDIILLIFLMFFIINNVAETWLKSQLISLINKSANDKYVLTIDKLHVSILHKTIRAEELSFLPSDKISSSVICKVVSIENINLVDFIFNDKINIGIISVDNSSIEIKSDSARSSDGISSDTSKEFTLYEIIRGKYSGIHIHEININRPFIKYFKNKLDKNPVLSSRDGKIHIINFNVDSSTANLPNRSFNADSLDIHLKNIKNTTTDSLYTVIIPTFKLSYTQNTIFIDSFAFFPNYNKKEFSKVYGSQTDRFVVFAKKVLIQNVDVKNLIENFDLKTELIDIDSLHLCIHRDKYFYSPTEKKRFIQELIFGLQFPLKTDRIKLRNSYFEYEELVPPSKKSGKIYFTNINATIDSICNYDIDNYKRIILFAQAKIFGVSPVEMSFIFPMKKLAFTGSIKTGAIEMSGMNSFLEPSMGATITNGIIDSLHFTVNSDNKISRGKFKMTYHDLRIALKDIRSSDTLKTSLRIKTYLANTIVLKQSNPEKNSPIRSVSIYYRYDDTRFLTSNYFQIMMTGFKKMIGAEK